jgi:hypothetical protein
LVLECSVLRKDWCDNTIHPLGGGEATCRILAARIGDMAPRLHPLEFEVALAGEARQGDALDLLDGGEATCRVLAAREGDTAPRLRPLAFEVALAGEAHSRRSGTTRGRSAFASVSGRHRAPTIEQRSP